MLCEPWLARAARLRGAHEALRTADGSLSYSELLDAAARVALPGPGARVGLALPAGRGFAVALHACLLRGCVAVPVDPRLGEAERAVVLSGCDAVLDEVQEGEPFVPAEHDLDAPAIVVHTSGTSGAPRPVELTFGNWLWSALGAHAGMGLGPAERWLCALPLSHVGGLSILLRSAVYGTTAVVHDGFDAERILAEEHSVVSVVPTTLARLLDAGMRQGRALVGGAPVAPALLGRAAEAGVEVLETYGLTEACSQVTIAGRPLFCTRVRLAEDAEILVSGPTVAPASGPVLATGDLGAFDDEGRLVVTGRKADTIVTGGENVAPAEVEAVLAAHPAVAEAAVHGRPDPEWGEAVCAVVVLRDGAHATEADLREHCRGRLAAFKVPKRFTFAPDLPKTASGKVQRRLLS